MAERRRGEQLKRLRHALGWTQEALAKRTKTLERSFIAKVEAGYNQASSYRVIDSLAEAFGVAPPLLNAYLAEETDLAALIAIRAAGARGGAVGAVPPDSVRGVPSTVPSPSAVDDGRGTSAELAPAPLGEDLERRQNPRRVMEEVAEGGEERDGETEYTTVTNPFWGRMPGRGRDYEVGRERDPDWPIASRPTTPTEQVGRAAQIAAEALEDAIGCAFDPTLHTLRDLDVTRSTVARFGEPEGLAESPEQLIAGCRVLLDEAARRRISKRAVGPGDLLLWLLRRATSSEPSASWAGSAEPPLRRVANPPAGKATRKPEADVEGPDVDPADYTTVTG